MPQPTNHETLTVGEVFQNALYNYEIVIDKYEISSCEDHRT